MVRLHELQMPRTSRVRAPKRHVPANFLRIPIKYMAAYSKQMFVATRVEDLPIQSLEVMEGAMLKGIRKKLAGTWRLGGTDPRCTWRLAEGPNVRGGMAVQRTRTCSGQFVQTTCEPWFRETPLLGDSAHSSALAFSSDDISRDRIHSAQKMTIVASLVYGWDRPLIRGWDTGGGTQPKSL